MPLLHSPHKLLLLPLLDCVPSQLSCWIGTGNLRYFFNFLDHFMVASCQWRDSVNGLLGSF